ncbi:MAG: hypothetical protein R3A79_21085 [Nannocystaceae bacterium]
MAKRIRDAAASTSPRSRRRRLDHHRRSLTSQHAAEIRISTPPLLA